MIKKLAAAFGLKSMPTNSTSDNFYSLQEVGAVTRMIGHKFGEVSDNEHSYIKDGYARNADLYAVINRICRAAVMLPWKVYEVKGGEYNPVEGTRLNDLLDMPNKYMGWSEWLEQAIAFKLITGNNLIYGVTPVGFPEGYFTEMHNMPVQFVDMYLRGNPIEYDVQYRVDQGSWNLTFGRVESIHRKKFNPRYDVDEWAWGMSPIRATRDVLARSNQAQRASNRAFTNNGAQGMISSGAEEFGISPDEAKRLEEDYRRVFGGAENRGKVVVTHSNARWTNFGLSPVDLAIIDSMKMDLRQFCNIYGVPIQVMNDSDSSTYNNISTAVKMLYTDAVLPELNDLRDHLNRRVAKAYGAFDGREYWIDYDVTVVAAFREEMIALSKRLVEEVKYGITTPNEARQDLGRSVVSGADVLIRQQGLRGS
jgi:HK97 family phage portal protein